MALYEVFLHGRGVRLRDEQGVERVGGVYALCTVRAGDADEALARAARLLWRDPLFSGEVLNKNESEITFSAEEMRKRPLWGERRRSAPVFYVEGNAEGTEGAAGPE